MDFNMSDVSANGSSRVESFMHKHVRPPCGLQAAGRGRRALEGYTDPGRSEEEARAEGLWNMFMPPSAHEDDEFRGAGLTNLEYAPLAEQMGHIGWASEVFNCSGPIRYMEVLMRYGTRSHKKKWLRPLYGRPNPFRPS